MSGDGRSVLIRTERPRSMPTTSANYPTLATLGDTQVKTSAGETAISDLKVGDTVEAYDPRTGETGAHQVLAVMVNTDPIIEHLKLDTGSIETTPNHPFFTADRGWILAGSLVIGEQVRTDSGHTATVTSFTLEATSSRMWDITVADAHSFFVGSGAVLVHNSNCGGGPPPTIRQRVIDFKVGTELEHNAMVANMYGPGGIQGIPGSALFAFGGAAIFGSLLFGLAQGGSGPGDPGGRSGVPGGPRIEPRR